MIRELVNEQLFELCEIVTKVKCSLCLLYWNQGIVYCTFVQRLIDIESRRKSNNLRLDALSIPNNVIKKGRNHGARHGKTEEQEYQMAWNAWKRWCKKVDSRDELLTSIQDRFLRDPIYRESQLAIGWTELNCLEWDELAQEDHTYGLTPEEKKRYQRNTAGKKKKAYETTIRFSSRCLNKKSSTPRVRRTGCRTNVTTTIQTMLSLFKHIVVGRLIWK